MANIVGGFAFEFQAGGQFPGAFGGGAFPPGGGAFQQGFQAGAAYEQGFEAGQRAAHHRHHHHHHHHHHCGEGREGREFGEEGGGIEPPQRNPFLDLATAPMQALGLKKGNQNDANYNNYLGAVSGGNALKGW